MELWIKVTKMTSLFNHLLKLALLVHKILLIKEYSPCTAVDFAIAGAEACRTLCPQT
jgi:hypothetical protein